MSNVKLFISYRRSDTEHAAQRALAHLQQAFGDEGVFIDREMSPGVDWADELARNIANSTAVIIMIGDRFVELMDRGETSTGGPDPMRLEIEMALAAGKKLYPVVVGPRDMPSSRRLPPSIAALTRHNAVFAPPQYFDTALQSLTRAIAAQHGQADPDLMAHPPPATQMPPTAQAQARHVLSYLSAALLIAIMLWALGRTQVWLLGAGDLGPAEAMVWHGARYALATALLGLGPYLGYWVVAELRARAWLPIYNAQGILTAMNMSGILIGGGIFLLLSTLPGWRLRPLLPTWLFPADPGVLHYVLLALMLLTIAIGTVALALLEPRARRGNREGRPIGLQTINAAGLLLLFGILWLVASLFHSVQLPAAQDPVPVIGYLMLCPALSLLMGAWQLAQAHLGVQRQGWHFRSLFGILLALYLAATLALFSYGPLHALLGPSI